MTALLYAAYIWRTPLDKHVFRVSLYTFEAYIWRILIQFCMTDFSFMRSNHTPGAFKHKIHVLFTFAAYGWCTAR